MWPKGYAGSNPASGTKNMDQNNDLDKIEEELKEKESQEEKTHHKVSGKSVFELQKIIKKKSQTPKEGNGDSGKTVAGDG